MFGNDWLFKKANTGRGPTGKYLTASGVGDAFGACCVVALMNAATQVPFWIIDPPQQFQAPPAPPRVLSPDPVKMLNAIAQGAKRTVERREAAFKQVVELQHLHQVPDAEFEAVLQSVWRAKHPQAPEPWAMKPLAWRKEVEWNVGDVSLALTAHTAKRRAEEPAATR